jgi:anti-sigma factor RsiW
MRPQWTSGARPPEPSGWAWWRRGREGKASVADAGEDEAERLLDLAGFADGRLGADDRNRVAAAIVDDPDAAADVVAAQMLSHADLPRADEALIARAAAALNQTGAYGQVISFPRQPAPQTWHSATAWSSLAAAIVLASWLGFDLGSGTSLLRPHAEPTGEDATTGGLFDPPLVRDFNEGWQT